MNSPEEQDSDSVENDRLEDALLREHARVGNGADEAFLARLESALDGTSQRDAIVPAARPARRWAWPMGLAASSALAAGLTWYAARPPQSAPWFANHEPPLIPLRTEFPPELIEGTPKQIILPQRTPDSTSLRPSSPSAATGKVIASQSPPSLSVPTPSAQPVDPSLVANVDRSDFEQGAGWGSGGGGTGTGGFAGLPPAARKKPQHELKVLAGVTLEERDKSTDDLLRTRPGDQPNAERYGQLVDNKWQTPIDHALSTFSVDVDTASYTNLRRMIQDGARIPADSVRLEEMVNYFDYSYATPTGEHPFAVHVANATCPWNPDHQLVRVALKGKEVPRLERAPANLVFLLDVSGSMNEPRKLPLVVRAFHMLIEELNDSDTLSIVVYAGAEGLALPPTRCDAAGRKKIAQTLDKLQAGGSTNGGAGIQLAYKMAKENFKPGGINRVILATDGDFNVGVTEDGGLVSLVEKNAKSKVFLTVLGFGTGNLNDGMMEAITNKGNGTYHYVDNDQEARRIFLGKMMGTLVTIAKDVKVQVEFNPAQVKRYRLLGYANRMLRKEDFANDKIDAGDIGSGHTVTAFYEVESGDSRQTPPAETLRYQANPPTQEASVPKLTGSPEWLTVKLRYKQPEGDKSTLLEHPYTGVARSFDESEADFRFASAVAMTGLVLRSTEGLEDKSYQDVIPMAKGALGSDPQGQRAEFVKLIEQLHQQARTRQE